MKVFITRKLATDSLFQQILTKEGYAVTGISLVTFFALPFQLITTIDWLFFYSKNGVKYYYDFAPSSNENLNSIQIAAMGEGTATALQARGHKVSFIGNGQPDDVATDFLKIAKGKRVVFIRAEQSRLSVQSFLESDITVFERIVYANRPMKNCYLPPYDIVVCTSPMNATTYFQYNPYINQKIFSIGPSTTNTLNRLGISSVITASTSSESALAEAILTFNKNMLT